MIYKLYIHFPVRFENFVISPLFDISEEKMYINFIIILIEKLQNIIPLEY